MNQENNSRRDFLLGGLLAAGRRWPPGAIQTKMHLRQEPLGM